MSTLRAAVIGCGKAGSEYSEDVVAPGVYSHAHAYSMHSRTDLVAVCDVDLHKAEACAARWGTQAFSSVGAMLSERVPEIVSICTPDETHAEVALQLLEFPGVKGVLCEKPLALSFSDAQRVVEHAAAQGIPLAVNYSRRYDEGFQRLRQEVADQRLGRIQAVDGIYGKGLLHNGSHWFDLLRFLFGEVAWVRASSTGLSFGADATLDVWAGLQAGFTAFLRGTDPEAFTVFEMDIMGRDHRVQMVDSGRDLRYYRASESPVVRGYRDLEREPSIVRKGLDKAMLGAVDNLVRHVETGEPLLCSGQDGLEAIRIVEAARFSAANDGRRINL